MKSRSAKNKGARLQKEVAIELAELFDLEAGLDKDFWGRQMGGQGTDIVLSKDAKFVWPFDTECKNQETWSVPAFWKQTVDNTEDGRKPLLVLSKNRHEKLAVIRFDDLKELFINNKNKTYK